MTGLENLFVSLDDPIRKAISCLDRDRRGIALVIDAQRRLIGTITDGDVRRAMLAELDPSQTIAAMLGSKARLRNDLPITARVGSSPERLIQLMRDRGIRQVPLLDDEDRVVGLVTLDELLPKADLALQAVVMAGGLGTRLRPLTEDMPKPMLPVGGKPLMEHIIERLQEAGVRRVNVTTHYKSEKIVEHFGDGSAFGVKLNYVNEKQPLGTGGALGLMAVPDEPFLVINGDILTQVNFRAMLAFHQEHRAEMTVAVRRYELEVPYGVIECSGAEVRRLKEKPQVGFLVNAGVYLLQPSVYEHIPPDRPFNMTDLIQWLLNAGKRVISFPILEYWLDIGQHTTYAQAQADIEKRQVVQ